MTSIQYFTSYKSIFSNFYPVNFVFEYNGSAYYVSSSEMAFMVCKLSVLEPALIPELLRQTRADKAKAIGRKASSARINEWDRVKDQIMYEVIRQKFTKSEVCRFALLNTGDNILVEASTFDAYWGAGLSEEKLRQGYPMRGLNKLGEILMRVRSELRGF